MNEKITAIKDGAIRLAGVIQESIVDGPGLRFVVFAQGCNHGCPECHNPDAHDVEGGYVGDINTLFEKYKENPMLRGVTISGGEPFLQAGIMAKFCEKIKKHGGDVIVYTGFTWEQLLSRANSKNKWLDLIDASDYIIDGLFILEKKTQLIPFRGSENQRFIDVKKSLKENKVVLFESKNADEFQIPEKY